MGESNGFKVISGGQTGVDRAALDAAMELGLEVGGFCPKGRKADDGRIADVYPLIELASANYLLRTEKNVVEADGTLILAMKRPLSGGTEKTRALVQTHSKPGKVIELEKADDAAVGRVQTWLREKRIRVLNVAGPRESGSPGIYDKSRRFLLKVFAR